MEGGAHRQRRAAPLAALAGALLALAAGCGEFRVLRAPKGWPQEWRGRRLYNTRNAYIYARGEAEAREADALARHTAREFEHDTEGRAPKGLLLVTGPEDPPILDDPFDLFAYVRRADAERDGRETFSLDQITADWEAQREELAGTGMTIGDLVSITPVPFGRGEAVDLLGFPAAVADAVPWGAAVATEDAVDAVMAGMIRASIEREAMSPAQKVALAPLLAYARKKAVKAMLVMREMTVYAQLVEWQPKWDAGEKRRALGEYRTRKGEQMAEELPPRPEAEEPAPAGPAAPLPPEPDTGAAQDDSTT